MAKNFKEIVIYKSIREYDGDGDSKAIAYAAVARQSWDTYCGKTNYTLCYLDILCPNEEVKKCYQEIHNNEKFCLGEKMIGCIKNFSYNKKTFNANYLYTRIVEKYNDTYLRLVLSFDSEIEQTDEMLLEKIESSYYNVAEAIADVYLEIQDKEVKNKKIECFDKLLHNKADIEIVKKEYNICSDKLTDEYVEFCKMFCLKPGQKIQVVKVAED